MKKILAILFAAVFLLGCINEPVKLDDHESEYHVHADFAVFLNGEQKDFAKPEFMSDEKFNSGKPEASKSPVVHLHDGKGNIIHVHAKGVAWGMFFESLQMDLNNECFSDETGKQFCTNSGNSLEFFINGEKNYNFADSEPKDLDRIAIIYGKYSEEEKQNFLSKVTDEACIPSGKCLERGTPEDESSCVTGTKCLE